MVEGNSLQVTVVPGPGRGLACSCGATAINQGANGLDGRCHRLACLQEDGWDHSLPDAARCPRENEVAWVEGNDPAQVHDEFNGLEQQVRSAGVLPHHSVDSAADC